MWTQILCITCRSVIGARSLLWYYGASSTHHSARYITKFPACSETQKFQRKIAMIPALLKNLQMVRVETERHNNSATALNYEVVMHHYFYLPEYC